MLKIINIVRYDLIWLKGTLSLDIRIERNTLWKKLWRYQKIFNFSNLKFYFGNRNLLGFFFANNDSFCHIKKKIYTVQYGSYEPHVTKAIKSWPVQSERFYEGKITPV